MIIFLKNPNMIIYNCSNNLKKYVLTSCNYYFFEWILRLTTLNEMDQSGLNTTNCNSIKKTESIF